MMPDRSRDPYERMLNDAIDSMNRVNESVQRTSLAMNTADSERKAIFGHIESIRKDLRYLQRLATGDGNGEPGYGDKIRKHEAMMGAIEDRVDHLVEEMEKKLGAAYDAEKMRWWAYGQIIIGLAAAASLALQFGR